MDCSPPGSSVHEILQARLLECVAIFFCRASSRLRDQTRIFCIGSRILYHWTTWEARGLTHRCLKCYLTPIHANYIPMHERMGEGNGNPLQYFCLENPVDRGAWRAAVYRVAWSWAWLKWLSMHWRRKWQPTLVFLPGESQGQRSLVGCCLSCRTESDMTEVT